jgi:hypothetical protein
MLQTEFVFTLPCGYIDEQGSLHRQGVMRRATALDEVEALASPRVRVNEAYLSILLLSRVLVQLGPLRTVGPAVIEKLFASDFIYLQELYAQVNGAAESLVRTSCPACGTLFALDLRELHEHP